MKTKTKGIINAINRDKSFGEITTLDGECVNFELFECDYDFVRVGDSVIYDLVKIADGKLEALNVNFSSNLSVSLSENISLPTTIINGSIRSGINELFPFRSLIDNQKKIA